MTELPIRPAHPADMAPLATLWHDSWQDTHARFLPESLLKHRTLDSFRTRLQGFGDLLRTAGDVGKPLGLCSVKTDELDQLYVAPEAKGTGLADRLLADGEARIAGFGTRTAHLLCLKENTRAARFYARHGWIDLGPSPGELDTLDGPFEVEVLRFEKTLL